MEVTRVKLTSDISTLLTSILEEETSTNDLIAICILTVREGEEEETEMSGALPLSWAVMGLFRAANQN